MIGKNVDPFKNRLFIGLLLLLVWLPLPIGSEFQWAIAMAECCLFLLVILAFSHYHRSGALPPPAIKSARPVLLMLIGYIFWLCLQMVPLPLSILMMISPHAAALHLAADSTVTVATISITPYETKIQAIEASYLTAFFTLLLYLVDSRKKAKWLIYTLLLTALAETVYGALMVFTGLEYSFFISKAELVSHIHSVTGTFHSRNSYASYLEIALALGVGYLLSLLARGSAGGSWKQRGRVWIDLLLGPKMRLRLLLIVLCLGLVMSHSRGGNIAFFASLTIAGILFLFFARKKPRATVIFLVSIIVLDIVLIGSWVGLSTVMTRLEHTSIQAEIRDDIYRASIPAVKDYLLTGSGAGSYTQLMSAYKVDALRGLGKDISYAYNDSLQIIVETGIFGFMLLASVVLYSVVQAIQRLRRERSAI